MDGGFEVGQFTGVIEVYIRPTPVAMATKIGNFNTKDMTHNLLPNTFDTFDLSCHGWTILGFYIIVKLLIKLQILFIKTVTIFTARQHSLLCRALY